MIAQKLSRAVLTPLGDESNFVRGYRHQHSRMLIENYKYRKMKSLRFSFLNSIILMFLGLLVNYSLKFCLPAGPWWFRDLLFIKSRLEKVTLSPYVTKDNQSCWSAYINVTCDTAKQSIFGQSQESQLLLQICADFKATKLQVIYSDSASTRLPRLRGGSFQKISDEVPCIGTDCPPVSITGNYTGIPTIDQFTNKTYYYIFLLPTLAPHNSGIVNSQKSIDMLWDDVIRGSWHPLLVYALYGMFFLINLIRFADPIQRLWHAPKCPKRFVYSVLRTLRLFFHEVDLIIIDNEDVPSSEPGTFELVGHNDICCIESPSNTSCHPNRIVRRCNSCPDLRRRMYVYNSGTMSMDDLSVPGGQRSEVSSDCESVVSVYQEQNRFKPSRPIYQRTSGWYDSGTSDNQTSETSETSESDDDYMSVTSEDYDTSSDSSFSAVEDTHSPPVRVVSFSSEGVVFEDYSEQTRQDPVGGE